MRSVFWLVHTPRGWQMLIDASPTVWRRVAYWLRGFRGPYRDVVTMNRALRRLNQKTRRDSV